MPQPLRIAAACAALLIITLPAQAQPKPGDRDMAELQAYRMTPATLKKVGAAAHAFAQAIQSDPRIKSVMAAEHELEALQDKDPRTPAEESRLNALQKQVDDAQKEFEALSGPDDSSNAASLDDMARKLGRIPHMSDALTGAGLTPHEFALFEMATMQAGFAAGFKKSGMLKQMPAGVSPENVQFYLDHEAEITQVQKEISDATGNNPGR